MTALRAMIKNLPVISSWKRSEVILSFNQPPALVG